MTAAEFKALYGNSTNMRIRSKRGLNPSTGKNDAARFNPPIVYSDSRTVNHHFTETIASNGITKILHWQLIEKSNA